MKALLPSNEAERLKALARYDILNTEPERDFDDITLLASHVCGTPIALITLVDENRQWFKSKIGMTESETSRDIAFCAHGILHADFFEVEDALADERFATNPLVTGDPKIRFYAGSPLVTPDGHSLGMLCVLDQVPRELNPAEKAALKALSRQVVAQLELRRNLAELKKASEALRESEKLFAAFMDHLPGFAWMKDIEGRYVYINKKELELDGYRAGAIGKTDAELWPAEIAATYRANDRQVISTRMAVQTVEPSLTDGKQRYQLVTKFPVFDQDGSVVMVAGAGVDITERKQAEEKLWQSLQLLRAITEGTTDAIFAKDREGRYLMINTAGARFVGKKPEEMIGLDDTQCFPDETQARIIERDRAIMKTGETRTDENISTTLAGISRVYLTTKGPLRDSTGAIIGLFGVSRDITERKRAEEALAEQAIRYKTLMETSADSIYVLNERGDLQEANAAFLRRRGYTAAEAKGLNVADWDAQWTREQLQELLQEKLRKVDDDNVIETRHRCKDGSVFDVEVSATRVRIGGEQLFFCVTRDTTERKQAEQALRESETKFRRLLASNITGVVFWTLDGDISDANDLFLNTVGYTREDLRQGKLSWKKLTPPEYAPIDEKAIGELIATGTCSPFEKEYIRKDGSRVSVLIGSALLEPHKESGSSFVMDITESKRVELALDERLRFETLLTELSAAFANLPTTTVDREIDKWLQNLVEFLDLDRAIFDQVGEDGMTLSLTHSHTVRGIDVFPVNGAGDQAPWIIEQLLLGNTVKWSRIPDDIPQQAWKEREFGGRVGAKSLLSIPVCIGGSVICAVSFTSLRIYRDWSDEVVARLRLVGEIFANAIARKRAAKELEEANHQLRFLSRRLFHLQEEERRHLARELHDEIGQALTGAKINLDAAIKESDGAKSKRIDETAAILERLLGQVRQISLDLRPSTLDDLGLVPALRSLLDQQGRRASVAVHLSAKNMPEKLDPEIQTTCFRITQEAITNTVRHANATRIDVDLGCKNGNLRLHVCDNGIGFDAGSAQAQTIGLGLIGIKERASLVGGRTKIISAPNKGTTIEVSLPLAFRPERQSRYTEK